LFYITLYYIYVLLYSLHLSHPLLLLRNFSFLKENLSVFLFIRTYQLRPFCIHVIVKVISVQKCDAV
jgi:hypothetical protein